MFWRIRRRVQSPQSQTACSVYFSGAYFGQVSVEHSLLHAHARVHGQPHLERTLWVRHCGILLPHMHIIRVCAHASVLGEHACEESGRGRERGTESHSSWQSSSQRSEYIKGLLGAVVSGISGSCRHLACGSAVTSHLLAVGAEFHLKTRRRISVTDSHTPRSLRKGQPMLMSR
jgi:hypothetical protein